jgi:hypothetical protein
VTRRVARHRRNLRETPDDKWRRSPHWKKALTVSFLVLLGGATLFVGADRAFRVRDSIGRSEAYAEPTHDPAQRVRVRRAIEYRIAQLLRPDESHGAISGDRDAREVEIGLLLGRLAIFDEEEGHLDARDRHMDEAIRHLKAAHHRDPTETHVRDVVAKQRASARAR